MMTIRKNSEEASISKDLMTLIHSIQNEFATLF